MKYYIRSGKLYTSGSPGSSACLCSIAGPFFTAAKSVEGEKGELILRTSIVHDRTRKYPEAKSYQMEAPDGSVLAEGHLLYAEGEHPQCLGRLPRVDRVALTAGCILPSCIFVTLLAWLYTRYRNLSLMQGILGALRPAVVSMILTAGITILLPVFFTDGVLSLSLGSLHLRGILLFLGALLLLRRFKLDPIKCMVLCGLAETVCRLVA